MRLTTESAYELISGRRFDSRHPRTRLPLREVEPFHPAVVDLAQRIDTGMGLAEDKIEAQARKLASRLLASITPDDSFPDPDLLAAEVDQIVDGFVFAGETGKLNRLLEVSIDAVTIIKQANPNPTLDGDGNVIDAATPADKIKARLVLLSEALK